jgi:geranylgeranyl diphosphate synthase type II
MDIIKEEFEVFLNLFLKDNPKYKDVLTGGKKIRPIIVLDIASFIDPLWRINQETSYKIKSFALALELIHSTSLIIDDLPTMDNDIYRRGELTFHKKYGQHSAYLMVYNLLTMIKNIIWNNDDKTFEYIELEELINQELINLVNGQKYDLDEDWYPENKEESRTLKISELKTGSLFKLAFLGPYYLLLKKDENLKNKLSRIGYNLGMAFQLSDDYLDIDIDNPSNNYGLETSIDELENKYIGHTASVLLDLRDLKWNDKSIIYKIIDLMNNRFESKK